MDENFRQISFRGCECPQCGDDYTHFANVRVYAHNEDKRATVYTISDIECDEHRLEVEHEATPVGRRAAVDITLLCENGHEYTVRFIQHKGMLFAGFAEDGCIRLT